MTARLALSPVCTCGETLARVPDRITRTGATYRLECAKCGRAERMLETPRADHDPERTSLTSAVLALADKHAVPA